MVDSLLLPKQVRDVPAKATKCDVGFLTENAEGHRSLLRNGALAANAGALRSSNRRVAESLRALRLLRNYIGS